MDFSKTTVCQRTRSCYDKLYVEYSQKKRSKRPSSGGDGGSGSGGGDGGLNSESDGDRVTARVVGGKSKGRSCGNSSEGLQGSDKVKIETVPVARRTRLGLKARKELGKVSEKGKDSSPIDLVDESEKDDDGGGRLQKNRTSLIEDDESENDDDGSRGLQKNGTSLTEDDSGGVKSDKILERGRVKIEVVPVARRTRQGLKARKELGNVSEKGKESSPIDLVDESEDDGEGGGGLHKNHASLIEDESENDDGGGLRKDHISLTEGDSGGETSDKVLERGRVKNGINPVASRTRHGLKARKDSGNVSKKGKNSRPVGLVDESEKDDDGGGGLRKNHTSLIEDDSGCEKSDEILPGGRVKIEIVPVARRTRQAFRARKDLGKVSKKGENPILIDLVDEPEEDNDDGGGGLEKNYLSLNVDDSGIEKSDKIPQRGKNVSDSTLVDECKINVKGTADHKSSRTKDCSVSSGGFPLDENDVEGAVYLSDATACLDDYDPSHSSRVESNEVKVSPVELDSIQADGDDDANLQGPKSSEEEDGDNDNPQKMLSHEEDGDNGSNLHDVAPVGNNVATGENEVIALSSSDSDNGEKDGNAIDDDSDDLSARFWTELVRNDKLNEGHEEKGDFQKHARNQKPASEPGKKNRFWTELAQNDILGVGHEENGDFKMHARNQKPASEPGKKNKFWKELAQNDMLDAGHEENGDFKMHALNQKSASEPGKNDKVNFLEPVVSKKRSGSSSETLKPVEGLSKKRRSDDDNRGDEDMFWQIVNEKSVQDVRKSTNKKYDQFGNKINVMKILTDAIREEGGEDTLLKAYVGEPLEEDPIEETNVQQVQSYKFKFEDEEDINPEKSQSEIEMDELFDEMNMYLQSSEIGSSNIHGVSRSYTDFLAAETDQATRCSQGKHQLTINDEFGIVCRYCSHVEMEIRDILPPLGKNGRGGGRGRHDRDKADNMRFSNLKLGDCNQDHHHDSEGIEYEKGTVWDLVPGVKESMYPHQRDGFEFIWNKIAGGTYIDKLEKRLPTGGSGCIISHAPGTGKSRLTIVFLQAFLKMYPSSRPLIIAPRSMLLTWEEEFKKWNVDFPFYNLNSAEVSGQENKYGTNLLKKHGGIKSPLHLRLLKLLSWKRTRSVLGITYRLFESLAGDEGKRKRMVNNVDGDQIKSILLQVPTLLVLDEGHTPRNDQSLMWKALRKVKTKRCIILSGTPFQNNFDELFNTLCLVNPLLSFGISSQNSVQFSKKRGWKNMAAKGQWDSITSSILSSVWQSQNKLQELKALIDPFVHVHKGTILQERLPGLRDALVVLRPTKTQKTLLARMAGSKLTLNNDCLMSLVSVHPSLLPNVPDNENFRKLLENFERDPSAGVKTHFLMELLKLSGAHGEKVLVFSQYIKPLEFIMELLKDNFRWVEGRECLYMDGQQEEKHRQMSINTLNDPKSEVKVLLASIRACSEGINLVGASRVVLLDVHWNPAVERQAISRAYRLGQKKLVHVYHLVTGSMEGEKYIRQVEKSQLSELVFSSKNKDNANPAISTTVLKDKILEEMVQHDQLQHMFEKVIYQPKEADLITTFSS